MYAILNDDLYEMINLNEKKGMKGTTTS